MTLKKREKRFLIGGGTLLLFMLIGHFYFLPYYSRLQKLQRSLPKKQAELKKIIALGEKYQKLRFDNQELLENLKSKQNQIISYSLLEELADRLGIRKKLKSIRPRALKKVEFFKEEALEIVLNDVTLEQVTRYLYEIEATDPALQTSRIHLQPIGKDNTALNVDFTISIFNENED